MRCHTALSDIEVEHEEKEGHLYHLRYEVEGEAGRYVIIATTRPETMLGDTAVAVHPDDARYQDLIGKTLILPLVDRRIPLLADDYVDPSFGTGAVKITPAHDPNDFEMGQPSQSGAGCGYWTRRKHDGRGRPIRRAGSLRVS